MFSATSETRDRAADPADARKFFFAIRTEINVAGWKSARSERQTVTTRFICDSKIDTRLSPFFAVRRDSASPDSPLREQMRQLMPERAFYLIGNRAPHTLL